jgi:hypothetical protein
LGRAFPGIATFFTIGDFYLASYRTFVISFDTGACLLFVEIKIDYNAFKVLNFLRSLINGKYNN